MYIDGLNKENFKDKYLEAFVSRATYGSLTLEEKNMNYLSLNNNIKVFNNIDAMKHIMKLDSNLSLYDIIDIANIVNRGMNIPEGIRKVNVVINDSKMEVEDKRYIREAMYSLLNNYYKIWDLLPIYEREAMFHREFIRIHPFEDGNGRTARIIMNYNLMKQNRAPIVIPKEERKKYFNFIEENKIKDFSNYIEQKSIKEFETMIDMYKKICGNDFEEIIDDVKIYTIKH